MGNSILDQENIVAALNDFLMSLGVTLPPFFTLVRVVVWLIGILLAIGAIMKLRRFKEPGGHLLVPSALWQMFFAVLCVNMDMALSSATETVFGTSEVSPISYPTGKGGTWADGQSAMVASVVLIWIQFVGYISFAKGILVLNKLKTVHPTPPDISMAKGMTHVIGGVLAANMPLFAEYLMK